jgi:hypothetical protein
LSLAWRARGDRPRRRLKEIDATIEDRFRRHRYAEIIVHLPGVARAWAPNSSPRSEATSHSTTAPTGWPASPA